MKQHDECMDGNEAAARIAYAVSEVISIYPITPARPMAEHCDDWSAAGRPKPMGQGSGRRRDAVGGRRGRGDAWCAPEGGAGDDVHGLPGAAPDDPQHVQDRGELTPAVIHVAARTLATHALSIFGDHSDVMHARATGWAMLLRDPSRKRTTSR